MKTKPALLLTATAPASQDQKVSCLMLDGLTITGWMVDVRGELGDVVFRDCTLVPGLSLTPECDPEYHHQPSLRLDKHTTARLNIERSILGPIQVGSIHGPIQVGSIHGPIQVEREADDELVPIVVSDSILDALSPSGVAVRGCDPKAPHAPDRKPISPAVLTLRRCTVFGAINVHMVALAENSIFTGLLFVARRQAGCVRSCYVPPNSRTPRRYECQPDQAIADLCPGGPEDSLEVEAIRRRVRPRFAGERYGTPVYARLSDDCATEIRRGADDESEMGVFHDLFEPQRAANLLARLDEYTPAGTDAGIIFTSGDDHDS